jgi:hypothetical protein
MLRPIVAALLKSKLETLPISGMADFGDASAGARKRAGRARQLALMAIAAAQ